MSRSTWVFLRGLARQHRHWEAFPQVFREAFPDAAVVLLDLPGNGELYQYESPTSMAEFVDAAREQLDRRNVHGPVNLLALSVGTMIGIEWMERYPCDIERAVLINTSLRGMGNFAERLRPENYFNIVKSMLFNSRLEHERLLLNLSVNLYADKEMLASKWASYAKAQPTSRMNVLRQLFAAGTYAAPTARPHEHVLILQSLGDRLVDPVCSTRIAEHWRWPLVSHPSAGHDLTLDDGAWVIAQIRQWLDLGMSSTVTNLP